MKRVLGGLSTLVMIGVALAWVAFLRPPSLGGGTHYIMVSGSSMEPTMHTGDFVIARSQPSYRTGDIVVYRVPEGDVGAGSLVIHRIVGGSATEGYLLQGDNPSITMPDLWRPTPEDIAGKRWVLIPRAGKVLPYLRSPVIVGLLAGLFAFWFVMGTGKEAADEGARPVPDRPRLPG